MEKMLILYGTETGNSELLALDAASVAREHGFEATVKDMEDTNVEELTGVRRLLVFCSTWGDGEQPDNAQALFDEVSDCETGALVGLNYGVLALGDTAFDLFCESGKEWDAILEAKGANRLVDRMDCDTDYEDDAAFWTEECVKQMKTVD